MCLLICNIDINIENIFFIITSHGVGIAIALLADIRANHLLTRNHFFTFSVNSTQAVVYRITHLFLKEGYFAFPVLYIIGYTINSGIADEQKVLYGLWTLLHAMLLITFVLILYDYLIIKNLSKHILNFFALYISFPLMLVNLSLNYHALANPLHSGVAFMALIGLDNTVLTMLLSLGLFMILSTLLLLFNKRMNESWAR